VDWIHVCSYFYFEEIGEFACKTEEMFVLFLNEGLANLGLGRS
jgi:hypothetical protein